MTLNELREAIVAILQEHLGDEFTRCSVHCMEGSYAHSSPLKVYNSFSIYIYVSGIPQSQDANGKTAEQCLNNWVQKCLPQLCMKLGKHVPSGMFDPVLMGM